MLWKYEKEDVALVFVFVGHTTVPGHMSYKAQLIGKESQSIQHSMSVKLRLSAVVDIIVHYIDQLDRQYIGSGNDRCYTPLLFLEHGRLWLNQGEMFALS